MTQISLGAPASAGADGSADNLARERLLSAGLLLRVALFAALLGGLYLASEYSYLLFHVLAELFGIVIAVCLFIIVFNARRYRTSDSMSLLGISSLAVGTLEVAHMISYKGMNILAGYDANLPTQLWIAMRYVQSLSLLLAAHLLGRRLGLRYVFIGYALLTVALLGTIFGRVFPACYVEGAGLTPFKIGSEYVISLIFVTSAVVLWRRRQAMDLAVIRLLIASVVIGIVAELTFTFYAGVYDLANLLGHYLTIVSVYLIYKAIIETSLEKPYILLFRDVEQSRKQLLALNETLEQRVQDRTLVAEQRAGQLSVLTAQLAQAEQRERRRLAHVLHDGLQQLLVGMHLRLEVLQKRNTDPSFGALIADVQDLLQQSIQASRSLVIDLSPPVLYERGLPEALSWLAQSMREKHGLGVQVRVDRGLTPLPEDLRLLLFQCVRELLFNVVKHAGVMEAAVHVSSPQEGVLQVEVSDRGAGMDASRMGAGSGGSSFGLASVRHRLEAVGGAMEIDSAPGEGTRVTVQVPNRGGAGDTRE